MRSLNRSLPRSSQPPEDLLRAFKSAALSVTTLYKEAATGFSQARQAGYQDALDDILTFLDKENLGLGDGEGWKVRQWATERLDGGPINPTTVDSEDEREPSRIGSNRDTPPREKTNDRPDSSLPRQKPGNDSSSPSRIMEPSNVPQVDQSNTNCLERRNTFTFQSNHPYPTDTETPAPENPLDTSSTLRFEIHPRATRHSQRHNSKHNSRGASTRIHNLGGGSKRKLPDFFDISGLGEVREGTSKRGRTT